MKFRKLPVVIEAMQLTMDNAEGVKEWCGGKTWSRPPMRAVTGISIPTLEGEMTAPYGDWIIKGVNGEFYPCKPDIFEKTYVRLPDKGTLVKNCARCEEDHEVHFIKLERPMQESGNTHWAICPNTGEPILMKIVKEG